MAWSVRSRRLAAAWWACWIAAAAPLARASTQDALELDADAAAREALRANPDREVALERIAVVRGRLEQAGRLANPELEITGSDDFAFRNEGERSGSLSFEQSFPVTARLARERDVAQGDVEIALAEVREFERGLLAEVLGAFYGVLGLEQRVALNAELVQSLGALEALSERRLRAAEVSRADLSLLRVERSRLAQRGARLGADRDVMRLRLLRLLGRPLDGELRVRGELEREGSDEAFATAWAARRPDLRVAELGVQRARADAELSRAQRWGDVRLRVGVESEREVFDRPLSSEKDTQLGVGVVVPLPLWNRNEGAIAAAEAEARRAERARVALERRAEEELRAALARVAALRLSAQAYRSSALPESTQALALLDRGYRQGLVSVSDLLQAQRQYAELRDEQLELLGELRRAEVELEAAAASNPLLAPSRSGGSLP